MDYNLNDGPFGLCSGYWDDNTNSFRKATFTEIEQCCLQTCSSSIGKCINTCLEISTPKDKENCYRTCNDIKVICEDNCNLNKAWKNINPITNITNEYGCGNGSKTSINRDCLIQNKDEIIKNCKQQCINTPDLNCQQHCEHSYDSLIDDNINPLSFVPEDKHSPPQYTTHSTQIYILYSIVISVVIFGLYLLYNVLKK